LIFDDTVGFADMDCFLLLLFGIPSPLPVDVVIKSRGIGVLTSLLLLSFKLRRRTGFFRIRLILKKKIIEFLFFS
jgi:hypothetical protein